MKNTKTVIKFFTIPQWKQEERYLRKQHKNGWEFVSVNGLCLYHFKKCEPKDVVYQLDKRDSTKIFLLNPFLFKICHKNIS